MAKARILTISRDYNTEVSSEIRNSMVNVKSWINLLEKYVMGNLLMIKSMEYLLVSSMARHRNKYGSTGNT